MLSGIKNYLAPKQCIKCGEFGEYVCKSCGRKFIDSRKVQQCHVCKKLIEKDFVHEKCKVETALDGILVCNNFSKLTESLITEMKYKLYKDIVNYICPFYVSAIQNTLSNKIHKNMVLVPVPMYKKKKWARGFNQAELISNKVGGVLGLESRSLLTRNKNTRTQVGLSKNERIENLSGAFDIDRKCLSISDMKYPICLIDDIMTTGTTLEECAAILRKCGFKVIYAIVLTRG